MLKLVINNFSLLISRTSLVKINNFRVTKENA